MVRGGRPLGDLAPRQAGLQLAAWAFFFWGGGALRWDFVFILIFSTRVQATWCMCRIHTSYVYRIGFWKEFGDAAQKPFAGLRGCGGVQGGYCSHVHDRCFRFLKIQAAVCMSRTRICAPQLFVRCLGRDQMSSAAIRPALKVHNPKNPLFALVEHSRRRDGALCCAVAETSLETKLMPNPMSPPRLLDAVLRSPLLLLRSRAVLCCAVLCCGVVRGRSRSTGSNGNSRSGRGAAPAFDPTAYQREREARLRRWGQRLELWAAFCFCVSLTFAFLSGDEPGRSRADIF